MIPVAPLGQFDLKVEVKHTLNLDREDPSHPANSASRLSASA
jgi:hypothetical protein